MKSEHENINRSIWEFTGENAFRKGESSSPVANSFLSAHGVWSSQFVEMNEIERVVF